MTVEVCEPCFERLLEKASRDERKAIGELLRHTAEALEEQSQWWRIVADRVTTARDIALCCTGVHDGYQRSARILRQELSKLEDISATTGTVPVDE